MSSKRGLGTGHCLHLKSPVLALLALNVKPAVLPVARACTAGALQAFHMTLSPQGLRLPRYDSARSLKPTENMPRHLHATKSDGARGGDAWGECGKMCEPVSKMVKQSEGMTFNAHRGFAQASESRQQGPDGVKM